MFDNILKALNRVEKAINNMATAVDNLTESLRTLGGNVQKLVDLKTQQAPDLSRVQSMVDGLNSFVVSALGNADTTPPAGSAPVQTETPVVDHTQNPAT